ncbi:MAG: RIP metalloprotease RseP [Candidatus Omnitrophota bacterium]
MLSTIAFIFVLGVLVLAHEFGHFIVAKFLKVKVEAFSLGFGKKLAGLKYGDTEYKISLIPLGGYVKLAGENPEEERAGKAWEFLSKSVGERAAIVIAGPLFNYLVAFLLFSLVFFIGAPSLKATVGEVKAGYPAQLAGLQMDDKIISIDGKKIKFWDELSSVIHEKISGEEIVLAVERKQEILQVKVVPQVDAVNNIFGEQIKVGLIGISPGDETEIVKYGFFKAIGLGAKQVVGLTQMTYFALSRMLMGKMSVKDSLAGPVTIFKITGDAAKLGFVYLMQIMGALSVSLAIINLFPVPVLDGGHLLFLFFEKIKGKPISLKFQEMASRVGFSILILLMVFVFYNDLVRVGFFEKVGNFLSVNRK